MWKTGEIEIFCVPKTGVISGKRIVLDVWTDYPESSVKVIGYPALDKYAKVDITKKKWEVRKKLGLTRDSVPIVLFAGQGPGTSRVLQDVMGSLMSEKVYFIPRPHPRTPNNFPEEMAPFQAAVSDAGIGITVIYDFFGQCTTPDLIAASDVVISSYSTVLIEAAALRKVCVAYLPPYMKERLSKETNGVVKEFPLTELGCALKAENYEELHEVIFDVLSFSSFSKPIPDLKERYGRVLMRTLQKKHIKADGGNAQRVADFLEMLA